MILIKNNKLIKKGYNGFAFYPFIFIRDDLLNEQKTIAHEKIHIRQQIEMLIIPFYIFYFAIYAFNILRFGRFKRAYYSIPFEREAFDNSDNNNYLKSRKFFAWIKYF